MLRERSVLGYPISDEIDMYDGRGKYSKFQHGFIVWTAGTGAHLLWGAIGQKWWELVERGRLGGFFPGYPTTDEEGPGDVRWNHFESGSIYWTRKAGAHEIHGAIRDLWLHQLKPSGPNSQLGSPFTDEKTMPDGRPYQRFQNGLITYSPNQKKFIAVPMNFSEYPYFFASRVDLGNKENISLGSPVTPNTTGPNLTGFQIYLQRDSIIANSIERHSDGSIYIAYTPRRSPYWYDPYLSNDTDAHTDGISFGAFGLPQLGLAQPQDVCRPYISAVPNLDLNYDYSVMTPNPNDYGTWIYSQGTWDTTCRPFSVLHRKNVVVPSWPRHEVALPRGRLPAPKWFKFTPQRGADTPPGGISAFPPFGIPRETAPFVGDRGAYCNYTNVVAVRNQDVCTVPCNNPCPPNFGPDGVDIWTPPEWATILPIATRNLSDGSLGTKTYQGEILTGQRMKQLAQTDPVAAANATASRSWPVRYDYCNSTVGWMSSDLEGVVTNSFLSGEDYAASHVGYPYRDAPPFNPNYGNQPGNPNYWLGYTMPRWFNGCGVLSETDSNCVDWVVYVQPDPEYQFLQLANQVSGGYADGNYNWEHRGSLENEIDQWQLPTDFRPEPGDRIYMTGRWVVDCGHGDWHGELHPIESYVSSHIERVDTARRPGAIGGIQVVAKVVVTGTWPAYPNIPWAAWEGQYPLKLEVWPPPRPTPTAVLHFEKAAPPQGNFGLLVHNLLLPTTNANHVEITVETATLETNFPRTHDYNQVYDPDGDGVRLGRRMAATYYLWWEKPAWHPPPE
jgi:hypothetical protein